ncbi:MAG TPA: PilT/PilU family type 4a pilus ATPase [Phycisphaerae bacterium]|nr:PilT/PilU family type 4a pilus ATPase [Phycisphaerae bacterium]HOJ75820.1 PilT/PilU family type 4a pilus ATPase [Phycisphaerae bacterium]HOM53206.1 PilT/PilU family type 4a pilus ATPase [Phycisphaerae bacterium]HON67463.1 PilT/PilU family type 4a pilus ATPase [Phycisphaerae bacterium]HOQ87964.1 PilT/PilU family type 4a pilus ATPase [Phycisphaerae bacterium]
MSSGGKINNVDSEPLDIPGGEEQNGQESSTEVLGGTSTPAEAKKEPKIHRYLKYMVQLKASDLHFKSGARVHIRHKGQLKPVKEPPLTPQQVEEIWFEIMNDQQKKQLATSGAADFAYQLGESDRFRVNIFRQRGVLSVAARRVNSEILDFRQLYLPESMYKITEFHQGLVLLAGITGSGKSTTIAAALDYINQTRACHIVTIEDPIEYLFRDKKSLINQREVHVDVANFQAALKYLMRQDPDVVLVGEMRDEETFMAALNAAETGHLVFGTIHASGAAQTIGRVLDLIPEGSRDLVRQTLVFNLQAIICQKLLPSIKPGVQRVPAVEIMFANSTIRKLIDEKRDDEIPKVIRACEAEGMMDMNSCLKRLVEEEFIETDVAYAASPNPQELKMRLKGISSGGGGILG